MWEGEVDVAMGTDDYLTGDLDFRLCTPLAKCDAKTCEAWTFFFKNFFHGCFYADSGMKNKKTAT